MLFRKNKEELEKQPDEKAEHENADQRSLTSATGEYEAVDAALAECVKDTQKTVRTAKRISSKLRAVVLKKD